MTLPETFPKITTIMAVYNMADTVQRAIDSVIAQEYPNKELIIIEGASSDNTVDIIRNNGQYIDYWESVSESERGIYKQWNKALLHVSGEWINFLGADDYFPAKDVMSRMHPHLVDNNGVRLIYGQIALVRSNGSLIEYSGRSWEASRPQMYKSMPIPHPATFHHRSLFVIHGQFNETFRIAGDYEFLLRELKDGKAQFIPNVIVRNMTFGGMSTSWNHDITRLLENARARKLNSLPAYTWPWLKMFVRKFIRHMLFCIIGENRVKKILRFL